MATPYTIGTYSGKLDLQAVLTNEGRDDIAGFFEGIAIGFKVSTSDSGERNIEVGSLSKKDWETIGQRAAETMLGENLIEALGGIADNSKKK